MTEIKDMTRDELVQEVLRWRAKHAELQQQIDDDAELLQSLCDQYGALGGDDRISFIAGKLGELTVRAEMAERFVKIVKARARRNGNAIETSDGEPQPHDTTR